MSLFDRPIWPMIVHFSLSPSKTLNERKFIPCSQNGVIWTTFHQITVKSDRNMNKHIGLEEEMSRLNDRISEAAHGVQRNVLISTNFFLRRESHN